MYSVETKIVGYVPGCTVHSRPHGISHVFMTLRMCAMNSKQCSLTLLKVMLHATTEGPPPSLYDCELDARRAFIDVYAHERYLKRPMVSS